MDLRSTAIKFVERDGILQEKERKLQEKERKLKEEEGKIMEEERKLKEKHRKMRDVYIFIDVEERKRRQPKEEKRKLKEEKRKLKEEKRKLKEEKRKLKEEKRKIMEGQRKLKEEERKLKEEKRKLNEEERKLNEEGRKLNEEERKLNEEERKLKEEKKRLNEEERKIKEEKRRIKEEKRRLYYGWPEGRKRQMQLKEEEERNLNEEERKLKVENWRNLRRLMDALERLKEEEERNTSDVLQENVFESGKTSAETQKGQQMHTSNVLQENLFESGKMSAEIQKRQQMHMQSDLTYYRMLLSLFIFYISSQCSLGSPLGYSTVTQSAVGNYKIGEEFVDWTGANAECVKRGFELASKQDTDAWNEFAGDVSPIIPLNTKLWIDYYVEYTPWISEEGCYKRLGQFKHNDVFEINDNYRRTCASKCNFLFSPTYFLLKGSECFCIGQLKQFINVDRKMCNVPCPGEKNQMCGGDDLYNGYLIENTLRLEEDRGLCVTYERIYSTRGTKEAWRSSPCWTFSNFICKVEGQYIIPPYKASWTYAALLCTDEYNGFLINDEETDLKLQSLMTNGTRYWVGKFRDVSIIHREKSSVKKCLTVVKKTSELIDTEVENCEEKYRPLCQKEVPVISNRYNKVGDEDMTTESTLEHFPLSENGTVSREPNQPANLENLYIKVSILVAGIAFGGLCSGIIIYVLGNIYQCKYIRVLERIFKCKKNDKSSPKESSVIIPMRNADNGVMDEESEGSSFIKQFSLDSQDSGFSESNA